MLCEFNKLRCPPPEQERIQIICKHSLEKYRVALYGSHVSSVTELLLRAHELHAVLGADSHQDLPKTHWKQQRAEPQCYKCSHPGYMSKTCPSCNQDRINKRVSAQSHNEPHPATAMDKPEAGIGNREFSSAADSVPRWPSGNFKGGRTFHRGHPPDVN
ncbi:hypothetical protein GOODEAATRI_032185 [Goodea atripinnis]|uniref:CCHC-type domain-containing protein n=1 Tax=Goodea atripinnis TaxID=208336 RepID=A0ABV0MWX7_9TELE